jgi:hypothetical protein
MRITGSITSACRGLIVVQGVMEVWMSRRGNQALAEIVG